MTRGTTKIVAAVVVGLILGSLMPSTAWASVIGEVTVNIYDLSGNKLGWAKFDLPAQAQGKGPSWSWSLDGSCDILDAGSNVLATITQLSCAYDEDPAVALDFAVVAGASPTVFEITSSTVGFAALTNPDAYATSAITVTDRNGNGASATGMLNGGTKSYEAVYNGATTWASLITAVTAPAFSSNTGFERRPPATQWETINDTLTSIQSKYKFTLTAGDSASGTSYFEVVPEPMTLTLLSLGAVATFISRRRNRR
jgi:hypothetical protein